jgi:hypothetical protein
VEWPCEGLAECFVPFLLLHLHGLIEQLSALEILNDKLEQVDVPDAEFRSVSGDVFEQGAEIITDAEFVFRGVIKDVEGNFVAYPAATEEVIREDSGQNPIESFVEWFIFHGAT